MSDVTFATIRQKDGYIIKMTQYKTMESPKASILILHGMAEHQKRYKVFAEFLSGHGYDVFTYDHRGHGTERKINELGFFGSENGDKLIVEDTLAATDFVRQNNRGKKMFLFGHSMGSLIARNVIQCFDQFDGVILCGTANPSRLMTQMGLFLSAVVKRFKGPKHISPFLHNLLFGGKKYTSLTSRTTYDWLSRSNPVVGAYIHDPYCGFTCTAALYHDLIRLTANATKRKLIGLTRKDLPLYIISGERDPVGGCGKEVQKYIDLLRKLGFSNVTSKLYPECRHELLNEFNHDEVFNDILQWITKLR